MTINDARWPITITEWPEKVPGWDLHDIEGYLVAVPAGTTLLRATSAAELHAMACEHDDQADGGLTIVSGDRFDTVHQGRWDRRFKYGVHWCIRVGTTWFASEQFDVLARMVADHEARA